MLAKVCPVLLEAFVKLYLMESFIATVPSVDMEVCVKKVRFRNSKIKFLSFI